MLRALLPLRCHHGPNDGQREEDAVKRHRSDAVRPHRQDAVKPHQVDAVRPHCEDAIRRHTIYNSKEVYNTKI